MMCYTVWIEFLYSLRNTVGFQSREMMIRDLSHLDFKIISEWTEYFRDMLHLKEKLQEAKGELRIETMKRKLID